MMDIDYMVGMVHLITDTGGMVHILHPMIDAENMKGIVQKMIVGNHMADTIDGGHIADTIEVLQSGSLYSLELFVYSILFFPVHHTAFTEKGKAKCTKESTNFSVLKT